MNEAAVRTEEQIISLFPGLETEIYRGWILKQVGRRLVVHPLYKGGGGHIADYIKGCEQIGRQRQLKCIFRIVEQTNYYLASVLADNGYDMQRCGVVGELSLPNDEMLLPDREIKPDLQAVWDRELAAAPAEAGHKAAGVRGRGIFYLHDGNLPGLAVEEVLRFSADNKISRILVNFPDREALPESYVRKGFWQSYGYRCYGKEDAGDKSV